MKHSTRLLAGLAATAALAIGAAVGASRLSGDIPAGAPTSALAPAPVTAPRPATPPPPPATAAGIRAERERLDRTVWAKEVEAQDHERYFIDLWDAMRAHDERQHLDLANATFATLSIKPFGAAEAHPWSISVAAMTGEARALDPAAWRRLIDDLIAAGYRLEHSEWHHAAFEHEAGKPARSTVTTKLYLANPSRHSRLVVAGPLGVTWDEGRDERGRHAPTSIDATALTLTERVGDDAFVDAWARTPKDLGADPESTIDPVLVSDLDGDGAPDILLPSIDVALMNRGHPGEIAFARRALVAHPLSDNSNDPRPYITAGLIADLTGDGIPDLVVAGPGLAPRLYVGAAGGTFPDEPRPLAGLAPESMHLPECITAGDVDGDGRPDLWIGQYRRPYEDGNLPSPYWDADDGWPSYLLLNRGDGVFVDATEASGLAAKRHRRNYSASLVDLDGDGDLDLVTVNDFAGVDLFRNTGRGRFVDAAAEMTDERTAFGMSHALADLDGDGVIDLFIGGMGSTTARRLEQMKLGREEFPEHQRERMKMGYGNRLLLGTADHRFRQAAFNDQVARTGWSWGVTALDVANEGRQSLFLTNGNMSRRSAKDYCTRYWTQDIYVTPATPADELAKVFARQADSLVDWSWNPFEHKALLMNEGQAGSGTMFRNVAYPMNLGFEWDGRQAISADFDGDGLPDLAVVETHMGARPYLPLHPVLHVIRNAMPAHNHWIAVRLRDEPGHSPLGARITVNARGREQVAVVVAGDSYRCQHPTTKHFGLGSLDQTEWVEVRWADGATKRVIAPGIDRVVLVEPDRR